MERVDVDPGNFRLEDAHLLVTRDRSSVDEEVEDVAICTWCGNEMLDAISCSAEPFRIGANDYPPIRWGDEKGYPFRYVTDRCGDCGVPKGAVHHHGCDLEQCPACLSQALSCGCLDDAEAKRRPAERSGQRRSLPAG